MRTIAGFADVRIFRCTCNITPSVYVVTVITKCVVHCRRTLLHLITGPPAASLDSNIIVIIIELMKRRGGRHVHEPSARAAYSFSIFTAMSVYGATAFRWLPRAAVEGACHRRRRISSPSCSTVKTSVKTSRFHHHTTGMRPFGPNVAVSASNFSAFFRSPSACLPPPHLLCRSISIVATISQT